MSNKPVSILSAFAVAVLVAGAAAQPATPERAPSATALAALWERERLDLPMTPMVTHEALALHLDRIVDASPARFSRETIGTSIRRWPPARDSRDTARDTARISVAGRWWPPISPVSHAIGDLNAGPDARLGPRFSRP